MKELFFEDIDPWHSRAKVFGGWLVKAKSTIYIDGQYNFIESVTYVPDPNHEWIIE